MGIRIADLNLVLCISLTINLTMHEVLSNVSTNRGRVSVKNLGLQKILITKSPRHEVTNLDC
jgi:hypothetical protein